MISNKAVVNLDYYTKEFMKDDYYNKSGNQEEGKGIWNGKAFNSLNLSKDVKQKDFWSVLNGINPNTDEKLSKYIRKEQAEVGQDFVINANKDFTLLFHLYEKHPLNKELKELWEKAQAHGREEIEKRLTYRDSKEYKQVAGAFIATWQHKTSREQNGKIDPHLHSHNVIANYALSQKGDYKAVDFKRAFQDKLMIASQVQSILAKGVQELGFEIEEGKTGWQLKCISEEVRKDFSGRGENIKSKLTNIENPTYEEKQKQANVKNKKTDYQLNTLKNDWNKRLNSFGLNIETMEIIRNKDSKNIENTIITKDDIIKKAMSLANSNFFTKKHIDIAIAQKSQVYSFDTDKIKQDIFNDDKLTKTTFKNKSNTPVYYHKEHTTKDFSKTVDKADRTNIKFNQIELKNNILKDKDKSNVKNNIKDIKDKSNDTHKESNKETNILGSFKLPSSNSSNNNVIDTQETTSSIDQLEQQLFSMALDDPSRPALEQKISFMKVQMLKQIEEKARNSYKENNQEQQQQQKQQQIER